MRRFFTGLIVALIPMLAWSQTDRFIEIDKSRIHYQLLLKPNTPLVVLEAGARSHSAIWSNVIEGLMEKDYSVFAYDRPGLGQSSASNSKRNGQQIARDLKSMLNQLGLDQELILVGHSMGGMYLGHFNALFPDRVKGLVMIDTPNGSWESELQSCLTSEQNEARQSGLETMRASLPETVRNEQKEGQESLELLSQLNIPNPLTVLSGGQQNWPGEYDGGCLSSAWREVQLNQLKLSDQSRQIVVPTAGHNIPVQASDFVIRAIEAFK